MLKRAKVYFLVLGLASMAHSTPVDNITEITNVIKSTQNSKTIQNEIKQQNIFAIKKVSGMEMIITEKKSASPKIDISLEDILSQVTGEANSENIETVFNHKEDFKEIQEKNPNFDSLLADRALEINYKNIAIKLKSFITAQKLSKKESLAFVGKEKILYLTFDDGPIRGTENVLRVLKEEGVDATMFCVGKHILKRKDLFEKEKQMSNLLVVNHTYSHANGHYRRFYSKVFRVLSDIEHGQLIVGGRKYLRLAGRNVWRLPEVRRDDYGLPRSQRRVEVRDYNKLAQEGYYIFGWDVEWGFNHKNGIPTCSATTLADRIERVYQKRKTAKKNRVVLLTHDFMFRNHASVNELKSFIKIMKNRGWKFKKIDHYVSIQPEPLRVAKYYKPTKRDHLALSRNIPKSSSSLHLELNNAVKEYDAEKVSSILNQGVDPNHQDKYGRLALNTAIKINSIKIVKKLIAHGAKITAKDKWGNTPLTIAKKYHRRRIQRYLIKYMKRFEVQKTRVKKSRRRAQKVVAKVRRKRPDALSILRSW